MRRVCILAGVLLSSVLTSPPIRGQQPSDPDFSSPGLQPKRSYFAQFPFESVDMVNGNLLLTFTDLVLPGNAGMDLRVQRTFNKQGSGWRFGLAGVPMEVANPEAPWPEGDPSRLRPSLITADGTAHGTMPFNGLEATDVWITQQFWRYTLATRTVDLPNGWTATYSGDPGRALLQEVHDPFGNQISVAWDAYDPQDLTTRRPLAFTQTVGDDTREVSFTYETSWSVMPKTMLFDGRTWTFSYTYDPFRLESVAPPAGPAWQFDYSNGLKLTTPAGGTVHYTFEDQTFPDDAVPRAVVRTRATGGRAVSGGTWTFTYTPQTPTHEGSDGVVETSSGPTVEFKHEWSGLSQQWLLARKVVRNGQTELARLDRAYTYLNLVPWSVATEPVVASDTLLQGGGTYTTVYEYSDNDAAHHFGDYHRPWKITESGDLTRVTTRDFDYDFNIYLLDRTRAESISVGGESFTTDRAFDDATGFMTEEKKFGVRTRFSPTTDGRGNVATVTDDHDHEITYTYKFGVIKNTGTELYSISRTINVDGTVASEVRSGHTTSFGYDAIGRQILVDLPAGHDIVVNYDAEGDEIRVSRGTNAAFTTSTIDGFGRVIATVNSVGVRTRTNYDQLGRKTYESLPYTTTDVGTTFTYDSLHRLSEATSSDGKRVKYDYLAGVDVKMTDQENHETTQDWAAFGNPGDARLMGVTDAKGKAWTYQYNALGRLTQVTQPEGQPRTWVYKTIPGDVPIRTDLLAAESHPESGTTSYVYDSAGRLQSKSTSEASFTYGYDDNDRLTSMVTSAPGTAHDVYMEYDNADNRTEVRNEFVTSKFQFDGAGRLDWRKDTIAGQPERLTDFGYDDWDNLIGIQYPSGHAVTYRYDSEGRVNRVCRLAWPCGDPNSVTVAEVLEYHPSGAVKRLKTANGIEETFSYDTHRYWLSGISGTPLSVVYGHDAVGNVKTVTDTTPSVGYTQSFDYDAVDRLEKIIGYGAADFTYDALGNRLTKSSPAVNYTYHATTKRLSSATGALPNPEVGNYTYDNAGNMTTDPSGTYTYTPFNMPEVATINLVGGGQRVTTYRYDGDNSRKVRIADGATDYFFHGPSGELLSEYRGSAWWRDYMYLGSRLIASVRPADPPTARFPLSGSTAPEGTAAHPVRFVLVADEVLTAPVPVQYSTVSGTATAGSDFQATSGTFTFTPGGATEHTFTIPILHDRLNDPDETFTVELRHNTTGALLSTHTVTITNVPILPGDFNNDGKLDLIWQHRTTDGLLGAWFMNVALKVDDASLTPNTPGVNSPWHIVGSADYDHDGYADLFWQNQSTGDLAAWRMGGANGTIQQSGTSLNPSNVADTNWKVRTVADMDGDGHADLIWQHVVTGQLAVWWMEGLTKRAGDGAQLLIPDQVTDTNWVIVGSGDANHDGHADLFWHHRVSGNVAVWFMNGRTLLAGVPTTPVGAINTWQVRGAGDFDGNGYPDLVWQETTAPYRCSIWLMSPYTGNPAANDPYSLLEGVWIINIATGLPAELPDNLWTIVVPK